jgi:Hemerythrin HHE cation binding domain
MTSNSKTKGNVVNPFEHLRTYVVTSLHPGDVRNHLQADHDRLLDAVDALALERTSERRLSKATTLRMALVIHARAEEAVVYRALSGLKMAPAAKAFSDDSLVEHEVIEGLLDKLLRTKPSADEWKARVRVFTELLQHHFREEQSEMFGLLAQHFDAARLETLGAQFLETRDKLVMLEEAKAA